MGFTPPFGQWLKERRRQLDLTQGDLARRVGYSPETIRKIEAGVLKPSKQMVDLLADHLGISSSQRDAFLAFATDARTAKPQPKPSNLPVPVTPLVGREHDVTAVLKLLKRDDVRLVTLVGPPGVGKTRLAIEAARVACDGFKDGVTFVELGPITDAEFVGSSIARGCGLTDTVSQPLTEGLREHLREKHMLLVVDNFEHVLPAAPLIGQALSAAPRLKVLVTSREPLRLMGEHRFNVPPLALPDLNGQDFASVVADSPAIEVFVQRAQAALSSFTLNEVNAGAVVEICRKLDGLPLALELAAPRVTLLTPKELLARLDRQLAVLTAGAQDLPPRQRTLRATIDWSYTLLSASEQALFRRLAVFAGGCTLEAIEAVCQSNEASQSTIIEGVGMLMAKNLLMRAEGANGQSRYRMLEMIREYASDKLVENGEADQWRLRHAEYYLAYADARQVGDWWDVQPESVEQVEPELDNLHAAIAWSQATDYAEIGLRLIPALVAMHCRRGSSGEGWNWIKRTLIALKGAGHTRAWAMAAGETARTLAMLGDYAAAQSLLDESLALFRELGDAVGSARMLESRGWLARERCDLTTAHALLAESLELYRALGDTQMSAGVLTTHGQVAVMEEDVALATQMLSQALVIFEGHRNEHSLGWTLNHLGHVAQLTGDYAQAVTLHERSVESFKEAKSMLGLAWAAHGLGETALSHGDASCAHAHFADAIALFHRLSERMGMSWCLAGFAGAAALDEALERGARLWGASEGLRRRIGCRIAPASRQNRERTVRLLREQLGDARFEAEQAIGSTMSLEQVFDSLKV